MLTLIFDSLIWIKFFKISVFSFEPGVITVINNKNNSEWVSEWVNEVAHLCPTLCNPMDSYQAPLSIEFSRQEYWSRLPFRDFD